MRARILVFAVALLALGLALPAQAQPVAKKDFAAACPLDLPGTTATSTATADGVTVAFESTVASSVAELKSRVTKLSDLINRAMAQPKGGDQRPAVAFSSTFEETKNGASLVLKPQSAADLEKLQAGVAGKINAMNHGKTCHLLANVN